jgi:hypothetical protein
MRKLCTDEVGEFKMKKFKKKKLVLQFEKNVLFFTTLIWLLLWLCISKMICRAWGGGSIAF